MKEKVKYVRLQLVISVTAKKRHQQVKQWMNNWQKNYGD